MSPDQDRKDRNERIRRVYQPESFAEHGAIFVESLAAYLRESHDSATPSVNWEAPERLIERATSILNATQKPNEFKDLVQEFLSRTRRLHSPRYMGHQVAPSVPVSGLFEALGAITNQGSAIFEMGPISTAAERAMVAKLGGFIGWKTGYDGFATHGGTLANLTGLLTARNLRYENSWEQGTFSGKRPAILVSADSHYSVARAAGILGIGTHGVIKVKLDECRRLRADAAEAALKKAKADGFDVFCVVAASGSTPVGAFDPLDELGAFASRHGLWLHADGCHGASALVSTKYRRLMKGAESADSLAWDAHKMLFVPAISTYLFYRNKAHSFHTFSQDAPYLFDPEAPGLAAYDGAIRTFECTKRSLAIGLWAMWSMYGQQIFEDLIDVTFDLGRRFYEILEETDDFSAVIEPEANIVCFRHVPTGLRNASPEKISAFQQSLRRRLVDNAEYYITSTRLDGEMVLRVTLINPLTTEEHLRGLLAKLRELGKGPLS